MATERDFAKEVADQISRGLFGSDKSIDVTSRLKELEDRADEELGVTDWTGVTDG